MLSVCLRLQWTWIWFNKSRMSLACDLMLHHVFSQNNIWVVYLWEVFFPYEIHGKLIFNNTVSHHTLLG